MRTCTKRRKLRTGEVHPEAIRRHEVSHTLSGMNLSPEKEEAVERLSCSLVGKLLRGPISKVGARAER